MAMSFRDGTPRRHHQTAMAQPGLATRTRPAQPRAAVRDAPRSAELIDTRNMRNRRSDPAHGVPQPDRAAIFPADDVLWGIPIREGFDELDDPWYHRGVMQHAFLLGNDRVALCGFRSPLFGPRDRRRPRLGLPMGDANPFCEGCVRRVGPARHAIPIAPPPGRVPVPMGMPGTLRPSLPAVPPMGPPLGPVPMAGHTSVPGDPRLASAAPPAAAGQGGQRLSGPPGTPVTGPAVATPAGEPAAAPANGAYAGGVSVHGPTIGSTERGAQDDAARAKRPATAASEH
jgi:hypothetical protein